MFTFSKINPGIIYQSESFGEIDNILRDVDGRVLLINSSNPADSEIVSKIKKSLKSNNTTFIQSEHSDSFINIDKLTQLRERSEIFNVSTIISVGELTQILSGRFISGNPEIRYIEIPTTISLTYMLTNNVFYSNRVQNDFEASKIDITEDHTILIDPSIIRSYNQIDTLMESLTILLNLSYNFTYPNNIISSNLSRRLFNQIVEELESGTINKDKLLEFSITAEYYNGTASDILYELTLYSHTAGYRFNFDNRIICSKLLPYFLEDMNENDLADRVRTIIHDNNISSRVKDMGISLSQLTEISKERQRVISLLEKAY